MKLREDLVPWICIFLGGLIAAVVCFTILDSTAETERGIPLTGGIVGALVAWSALANLYLQLRRSNRTWESLQNLNEQLQTKLIRSSPRPVGYEREIDERNGLVLARPETWEPRGGLLFSFSAPKSSATDVFSAELQVTQFPMASDRMSEDFYTDIRRFVTQLVDDLGGVQVEETIFVGGGDRPSVRSAKFTVQTYAEVRMLRASVPGEVPHTWNYISRNRVHELVSPFIELALAKAGISSPGAQYLEQFARIRRDAKLTMDAVIDAWRVDPHGGLAATVDDVISRVLSSNREQLPWLPRDTPHDPTGGRQDAAAGVHDLTDEGEGDREESNVVPVTRMFVATHYPNLHRAFLFDFVDNVGDFPASTALFNDVIGSVRFLE